jgi:hypothetical protein
MSWWLLLLLGPALARAEERVAVPCYLSHVTIDAAGTWECERLPEERVWTSTFQRFNAFGVDAQGYAINVQLFNVARGGGYVFFRDNELAAAFHDFNQLTKTAHDWSPVRVVGERRMLDFASADARFCTAFIYGENERVVGYERLLRGFICAPYGEALTPSAFERLLARIKLPDFEVIGGGR